MPQPKTPEEHAQFERWQRERFGRGPQSREPQKPANQTHAGSAPSSPENAVRRAAPAGVVTDQDKALAIACHASAFAACLFPLGNLIVPLIIWLANRQRSAFVDAHGKAALNFQISVMASGVLLLLLATNVPILRVGVAPGILILLLLLLVKVVRVAASAQRGEDPNYGFGLKLIQ